MRRDSSFMVISTVGEMPHPLTMYSFFPVLVFVVMLVLAATETIDIAIASMIVAAFFLIGGWVKAEEIPTLVDLRLLMLIGTSLSFATSMTTSGLALEIAEQINKSNPSPFGALLLVYAITLVITELISNNAAAALMYPIAVALADQLGVSFKTFAMAVLVSSTAGFMSPIGEFLNEKKWKNC
jgi:di/tricarboxylate transporter